MVPSIFSAKYSNFFFSCGEFLRKIETYKEKDLELLIFSTTRKHGDKHLDTLICF